MATVLRNRWTFSFGVMGEAFVGLICLGAAAGASSKGFGLGVSVAIGVVAALGIWIVAVASIFSCIRLRPDALIVDNLLIRHTIPWNEIKGLSPDDGMIITLQNGDEIAAFAFSGSVIGALTGYRTNNRVAERIRVYSKSCARRESVSEEVKMQFKPHVVILAVSWVFYAFIVPAFIHL